MAPDRATARHHPPLGEGESTEEGSGGDARTSARDTGAGDGAAIEGGPAAGAPTAPGATGQTGPTERFKRAAAEAAAAIVQDGMRVGLGTGSTVAHLLPALANRKLSGLRCAATSPATEQAARALGLIVEDLDAIGELDIAIDGADQVDPAGWLVKGGGAAQTREKIVAAAARRFVVIVSAEKAVAALHPPVPLELLRFGVGRTLAEVGDARLRGGTRGPAAGAVDATDALESPDGNLIADYFGPIGNPAELAARLSATPGVVEHGLFAPEMVSCVLIAGAGGVERRAGAK
jgi:ribose 5-phosphate isomerase A